MIKTVWSLQRTGVGAGYTGAFQPLGQRLAVRIQQGHHPSYARMADSLGRAMAREGIGLPTS